MKMITGKSELSRTSKIRGTGGYSEQSYRGRCESAAKHFLKAVVVIDDQAENHRKEASLQAEADRDHLSKQARTLARRPMAGLSEGQVQRAVTREGVSGSLTDSRTSHPAGSLANTHRLRAWLLTEEFANEEILCTVYRPDEHEEVTSPDVRSGGSDHMVIVTRSVKMARSADIVVLDWELGGKQAGDKGTHKARRIITTILEEDNLVRGRQRLIAVYTAEPNLEAAFSDVVADVETLDLFGGKLKPDKAALCLSNDSTRIVFLNKETDQTNPSNDTTVSEQDLPQRLILEFVEMNSGLLPCIALHSIASIREATHHILSTFRSHLDPALVSHRSLLPNPEDSEEFVLDLVANEIRSVLSMNSIGQRHAGVSAHRDWIAGRLEGREEFRLQNRLSIDREEAFGLVAEGDKAFRKLAQQCAEKWVREEWEKRKGIRHRKIPGKLSRKTALELVDSVALGDLTKHFKLPLLEFGALAGVFAGNKRTGQQIEQDFSRLTTLKRERYGERNLPANWLPRLTQGSIVRKVHGEGTISSEFLCCIQPKCDSVRIGQSRAFPFLKMATKGIPARPKQYLYVRCARRSGQEPNNVRLLLYPFPYRQTMLTFSPSKRAQDRIEAIEIEDRWVFEAEEGQFEWIADIRDELAQRLCDLLSGRQGSVGIDEYEWLRRKANS